MKKKIALFLCTLLVLGTGLVLPENALRLQGAAAESDGQNKTESNPDDTQQGDPEDPDPQDPDPEDPDPEDPDPEDPDPEDPDPKDPDPEEPDPKDPDPEEPEDPGDGEEEEDSGEEEDEQDEEEEELEEDPVMRSPAAFSVQLPDSVVNMSAIQITLVETGEDVESAENVDPYASITISFTFTVPDTDLIETGDYVIIRLPDEILLDIDQVTHTVPIYLDGSGELIANVILTSGSQEIRLEFTDEIHEWETIDYAYFGITCVFDGSMLEEGGERTILFEYDGVPYPYTVKFKGKEVGIAKELVSQDTESGTGAYTQIWMITANAEQAAVTDMVITERLPEGLEFTGYQFGGSGLNQAPAGWTVTDNSAVDGTVTFAYSGESSEPVEILIHTQITDLGHFDADPSNGGYVIVQNGVSLSGKGLSDLTASAMASVYAGQLSKTGTFNPVDGTIEWELVINDAGSTLENVTLYDILPDGLTLDEDSLTFSTESSKLNIPADVSYSSSPHADGTLWEFSFAGPVTEKITFTYTTKVDNVREMTGFAFTNQAYLVWGKGMLSTTSSVDVSGSTGVFTKSGVGYNGKEQKITWQIKVNENKYPFDGAAVITDDFMPDKNKITNSDGSVTVLAQGNPQLVSISVTGKDGVTRPLDSGLYDFVVNGDDTFTLTLEDGVVDEQYVLIRFTTDILDFEIAAGNDNKHYYNYAYMDLESLPYESEQVYVNVTPNVLSKSYQYDRETRTVTWKLLVNQFALDGLGAVTVTDTLPEELELVEVYRDSVDGTPLREGIDYTYDQGSRTVRFDFDDGELDGAAVELYLVTKIEDSFFQGNFTDKKLVNYATIDIDDLNRSYKVNSTLSLTNTLIDKSGGFDEDTGIISWEILINSSAVDWSMADVVLTDPLPQGLELDIESVSLYRYHLDGSGETQIPFDRNQAVSYNMETNVFEFRFPSDTPQGYQYRLFFDTEVLYAGDFENSINLTGFSNVEENGKTVVKVSDSHDLAGAYASRKAKITLQKEDEEGEPLAGATFELRTMSGDWLETAVSDENGLVTFKTSLKHEVYYQLWETEAPEGYQLLTDPILVFIDKWEDGKADPATLAYTAVNKLLEEDPDPDPDPGRPTNPGGGSGGGKGKDRDKVRPGWPGSNLPKPDTKDPDGEKDPGKPEDCGEPDGDKAVDGGNYNPSTGR